MQGLAARQAAAQLLAAAIDAHTPLDALTDGEHGHPRFLALAPRDRALVRAMLASALRNRAAIDALLDARLKRPLPAKARQLLHVLHVAAAQILFLDTPDSAAVDLAVTHARQDPRTARFTGLVNAVLRGIARDKQSKFPTVLETVREGPIWLAERLAAVYGAEAAGRILTAHRREAALDITVKADPAAWAEKLGGIVLPTGSVRLSGPAVPVPELPGFAEGQWWVQDAAAALPARLLGDVDGLGVADLCAAPGGKTAQLALTGAKVTAVDSSASRLKRLEENLARLKLTAEVVKADVLDYEPEEPFDAVLLDAPCSSTGTARRHPDVVWTKTPDDVARLAALQHRLLERALALVRPGGTVVFSNCSLDPAEGEELVANLLATTDTVRLSPIRPGEIDGAECFVSEAGMLRTTPAGWPESGGLDGFFAARLRTA